MDIAQPVVFDVEETLAAFHDIVDDLSRNASHADLNHRLVAYELSASRAILDKNRVFTTCDGAVYMAEPRPSVESDGSVGCVVLRAPLLGLVDILVENTRDGGAASLVTEITAQFPQRLCCWYSMAKQKACSGRVTTHVDMHEEPYVFCNKHGSAFLREESCTSQNVLGRPPCETETVFDEWLRTIV